MSGGDSATRECEERPTTSSRTEEDEEYDPEAELGMQSSEEEGVCQAT